MISNILLWVCFGILTGLVAANFIKNRDTQAAPLLMLGVIGALVGGMLGSVISSENPANFNVVGLFVAIVSSIVLIGLYKNISPQI